MERLLEVLPPNLTYHSLEHTKDVYHSAERLAGLENISGEDLQILLTAVLFHDAGFLQQQKNHELIGCDLARKYLPDYDYNQDQIERICGMIMATKIPQTPANKLEMIICDADLDYFGRDDFFTVGNRLFDELRTLGTIHSENEWNLLQEDFLEHHRYFTESAKALRGDRKAEHLAVIKSKIIK
ncbi:HD domain-containing protein [Taibaiella soli]|uniref:HD domain-containing protein n=1 Tax=Taibaiella soli TaxID=1649169 RepID=UPI001403FFFF|nr:HD domain-containing protein [Taibaiella soli]